MKAREYFNFKGRNFKLSFLKWHERLRRGAPLRYFLKPKEDNRTPFGKRDDGLGGILLIWLASFLLLASFTGRPAAALALSLPLLVIEALVLKKYRALRERRRRLEQRYWLAGQKFMGDILKMDPQQEFYPYVHDILAGLPGFQEVRLKPNKEQEGGKNNQGADLEGVYKGLRVVVRCVLQKGEQKTVADDLRTFARELHLGEYQHGLYLTTGEFDAGVFSVVKGAARKGIQIKLVNRYRLMDLARQAGSRVFQEEEPALGTQAMSGWGKRAAVLTAIRDSAFGSRKRAKSYFLYGLLLLLGSFFLKGSTALGLIYLFFAVLNFVFGASSLYFGRPLEEIDPLEGLGPEK